MSIYSFMK